MKARMFCPVGEMAGAEYFVESEAVIGRGRGAEIDLPSEVVSGRHARLYFSEQDESFWIEDLGSRNGTRLDGRPLLRPRKLGDLHVVTLAEGLEFILQMVPDDFGKQRLRKPRSVDDTAAASFAPVLPDNLSKEKDRETALRPRPEKEPTVRDEEPILAPDLQSAGRAAPSPKDSGETGLGAAPSMQPEALQAPPLPPGQPQKSESETSTSYSKYILMTEREDGTANSFRLKPGENLIGRQEGCAIRIQHPTVSRRHAVLVVEDDRVYLQELGGLNPVLLAGEKVQGKVEVFANQKMQIGQVKGVLVKR